MFWRVFLGLACLIVLAESHQKEEENYKKQIFTFWKTKRHQCAKYFADNLLSAISNERIANHYRFLTASQELEQIANASIQSTSASSPNTFPYGRLVIERRFPPNSRALEVSIFDLLYPKSTKDGAHRGKRYVRQQRHEEVVYHWEKRFKPPQGQPAYDVEMWKAVRKMGLACAVIGRGAHLVERIVVLIDYPKPKTPLKPVIEPSRNSTVSILTSSITHTVPEQLRKDIFNHINYIRSKQNLEQVVYDARATKYAQEWVINEAKRTASDDCFGRFLEKPDEAEFGQLNWIRWWDWSAARSVLKSFTIGWFQPFEEKWGMDAIAPVLRVNQTVRLFSKEDWNNTRKIGIGATFQHNKRGAAFYLTVFLDGPTATQAAVRD